MDLVVLKLAAVHLVLRVLMRPRTKRREASEPITKADAAQTLRPLLAFIAVGGALAFVSADAWRNGGVLAAAVLMTALARWVNEIVAGILPPRSWFGFLLWEAYQVWSLALVASAMLRQPQPAGWLFDLLNSPRTYGLIAVYAASIGLGSTLVTLVTGLLKRPPDKEGLEGAGRYIGMVERLLITSLVIFWPTVDATAIGFVFGAKSIARFPEFKEPRFAEYYLLGSLASFTIAIALGLVGRYYLPA